MSCQFPEEVITLKSGRSLGYYIAGSSHPKATVIYCHGHPGSSAEASLWHATATADSIRLISISRPGLGRSTRDPERTLTSFPNDVAEIVAQLGLTKYGVLGISGGGPYALACAARHDLLPGLTRVAAVVCPGPPDSTVNLTWTTRLRFLAMAWMPRPLYAWIWEYAIGRTARDPDVSLLKEKIHAGLKRAGGKDAQFAKDEDVVLGMTESVRGALAQGSEGHIDDSKILASPWGFELESIEVPVGSWCGSEDVLAGPNVARGMAGKIRGAKLVSCEGMTHMGTFLRRQEGVLQFLSEATMSERR